MKKTLIINLFAGPGTGKSTGAAYIFSKLKMFGIDCEYVTEFAKDKVWENNEAVFMCQMYVTGKQAFKISRCFGKVDVIITDSPIAIGAMYCEENSYLEKAIFEEFNKYADSSFNVFLKRVKDYNPNGRHQTEEEAKAIDTKTKNWLDANNIPYVVHEGNHYGYEQIISDIVDKIIK